MLTGLLVAGLIAGCGSPHATSSSSSNAAATSSPVAQVKQDWQRFFSAKTPASTKITLLQNGQQFSRAIKAQAASPLAQQASAQVSRVTLTAAHQARVRYTVLLAGKPALTNQTGTAIKSGSVWQVSDASFCALLRLEGGAPPACPKG